MNQPSLLDVFWILFSASLVFLMQPGFMCLESGLTRSKNSINVAVKNLADFCFSVLGFWAIGYALMFGTSRMGLLGESGFFFSFDQGPFPVAFFFFQVMFCGTATTIFSGAVAERMRFSSYLVIAGILSVAVYPVFGHWAWNGLETGTLTGWLGRRGFVDFAGSTVVHSVGGWVALAALLVIGPRKGRFPTQGPPREITPYNLPLSILGVMLLWFGWFGFNGGSTLTLDGSVPAIIAKTTLAASAGAATCIFYTWFKTGLPKVTALINGSLGGLVAITANCHVVSSVDAAVIGAVSGFVCIFTEQALIQLKIDDAVGAVPVHLGCGVWGTLAVALFGDARLLGTGLGGWAQLSIQVQGIFAAFMVAFFFPYFIIRGLDRIWPLRVTDAEEEHGLNVSEHGATTELHDLFETMDCQARTGDLSLRVPIEPFTEVGQIASRYNQVMGALEITSSKMEAVFRSASDAIVTFAADTYRILQVNPSAWRMFGFEGPAAMIDRPVTDLFDISQNGGRQSLVKKLLSHGLAEFSAARGQGRPFPVEGIVTVSGMADESFYVGTFRDISKRKAAETAIQQQQAFFRELFDSSPLGILMVDPQGSIVDANQGFTTLFGFEADEIRGRSNFTLLVPKHLIKESKAFYSSVMRGKTISRETVRRNKAGRLIDVALFVYPIRVNGAIGGIYYIYSDITQRKEFESQLSHQAFHDALTGLPNRLLFFERLTSAVRRQARRSEAAFAAMMLDMDRFKAVNDTLGHQLGDNFLVTVADRLKDCIRSVDTVARLGGDEFGIIVEDFHHPREVVEVAKRIMEKLEKPVVIGGNEIRSSASVGIVLNTHLYDDAEAVMRDADIAMYRAKEFGRARFKVFNRKMHTRILRESELERELHRAIEKRELTVHYQPIVSVLDTSLQGFEALVRWENPQSGMISPAEFIPVAEETGQIIAIGEQVLEEACRQMVQWQELFPQNREMTVSVNVSAKQFRHIRLVKLIEEVLGKTGLAPHNLKIELTESTLMKDARAAVKIMEEIKRMGVRIVVDDFGTGYSSLSYIQRFPIDGLKIDRSFISGDDSDESIKIVQAIIALAKSIGVDVVAEGVEEASQLDLLRLADCDSAQGYMFSKPLAGEVMTRWLHEKLATDSSRRSSEQRSGSPRSWRFDDPGKAAAASNNKMVIPAL